MLRANPTKTPYFMLDEVERLDDSLLQSLLGLAVYQPYAPIQGAHAPSTRGDSTLKARDADEYLYPPQSTYIKDVKLMLSTTKSKRAKGRLNGFIQGVLEKSEDKNASIETVGFRRISIRDAQTAIGKLLDKDQDVEKPPKMISPVVKTVAPGEAASAFSNVIQGVWSYLGMEESGRIEAQHKEQDCLEQTQDDAKLRKKFDAEMARRRYRDQVLTLLNAKKHGLGVIVGFITCTDMTKETNRKKRAAAELGAKVPGNETTGIDIYAELAASSSKDVGASGTYEGEYLIACSYLPLLKKENKWSLHGISFSNTKDSDWIVGPGAAWKLGPDPVEGDSAAPMGPGDGGDEDNDSDACSIVLLHPDDRIGENTGRKESDDEAEDESASDSDEDQQPLRDRTFDI